MSVKIYTKTGDDGTSGLLTGQRFGKNDIVFELLGSLDEFMAVLGFVHLFKSPPLKKIIISIQADLFEIGAFIAGKPPTDLDLTKLEKRLSQIEKNIDLVDAKNKPLKQFILPGGTGQASYLHYSRAICRRVERLLVGYITKSKRKKLLPYARYFNRLSDYLFVLARDYNSKGKKDLIWEGGFK